MVCKRPFVDEDSFWIGYKHPRHMDYYNEFASLVEFAPCNDVPHTSGDLSIKSQGEERHASNRICEHPVGGYKEFVIGAPCSFSSSYVTGNFNGKDSKSDAAVRVTQFPDFEADDLTKSLDHPEEVYSSFSEFAPRKLVSIGPDYQVDVPVWDVKGINNSPGCVNASDPHLAFLKCAGSDLTAHDDTSEQLMGFCVIPMPDSDVLAYDADDVGRGRADCSCPDEGSMRCVRQHIMEARDKLRGDTFGQETFIELGFYEMGEVVARKWSKEEEQVFHEVIFTNSSSSGKNFWDHLSVVFPSRTKKEIVSYYFNVFMLRKRAEQNRLDPLNIDSDNDEWEGSDAGDEEDEDSVVESPQEDHIYNHGHREHTREDDESGDESCGNDGDGDAGEDDLSDSHVGKFHGDCGFDPGVQFACEKNSENGVEDNSLQDDSCLSYDSQLNRAEDSSGPADVGKTAQEKSRDENDHGEYLQCSGYDELSSGVEHGHVLGPYDVKVWDFGCFGGLKKDADFLPTFNMIEEVFGEEAWLNKGSDRN